MKNRKTTKQLIAICAMVFMCLTASNLVKAEVVHNPDNVPVTLNISNPFATVNIAGDVIGIWDDLALELIPIFVAYALPQENGCYVRPAITGFEEITKLMEGEPIALNLMYSPIVEWPYFYFSPSEGQFLNQTGYIGLQLNNAGNTYYGWALVETSNYDNPAATLTVLDWAYQNTPGLPIFAGEGSGGDDPCDPYDPCEPCASGICNPSMEDDFISGVAKYWTGWDDLGYAYFIGTTNYAHEGSKSQEIEWYGGGSENFGPAGIYQQITSLEAGASYKVSAWFKFRFEAMIAGMGWGNGEITCSVGYDPNGGINPDLVTNWISVQDSGGEYYEGDWLNIITFLSPVNDTATLFLKCTGNGDAMEEWIDPGCDPECDPMIDPGCIPCQPHPEPVPWDAYCYIDDVNFKPIEIDPAVSTVTATTPVPATGAFYSEVTITVVDINGTPLEDIPVSEILVGCSGSGNYVFGLTPTDVNGQTKARITSTVAETKTVSVTVLSTPLSDAPVVEFTDPGSIYAPCEETKLLASDGAGYDYFGHSVAINNDIVIVGADDDDDNGSNSGSAYIFSFDGLNWVQEAKLLASDGASGDGFGHSVAIYGDTAIVGVPYDDDNGSNSGSAYIFHFDGSDWVEEAKLIASDGASYDCFGYSVAINNSTVIVGADDDDDNGSNSGSAYIFRFDGSNWVEETKLLASDGSYSDYFGDSVAIDSDTVVVGAYGDDDNGSNSGSAYIFRFDGLNWVEEAKFLASDGAGYDYFGHSVAINNSTVIIGAYGDDDNGSNSGSAYIFRFDGTNWLQESKLLAFDGTSSDVFGYSVGISGDTAIAGSHNNDDNGSNSGSAYLFRFDGANWIGQPKLLAPDGAAGDNFGYSVAIDSDTVVVGANGNDDNGYNSGSAYIFEEQFGDFDDNCVVDFLDFAVLASSWLSAEGESNWNRSCNLAAPDDVIDMADLAIFAQQWLTGTR